MKSSTGSQAQRIAPKTDDVPDHVAHIRDVIVSSYNPECIILFGSHAAGTARGDSDVDLLVIKRTEEGYLDRGLTVRRALGWRVRADVMVLTPEEYEQDLRDNRYFLTQEILPKGRTIYERSAQRRRQRMD